MQFVDNAAALSGIKETAEGYLIADCYAVRAGIQLYSPREVGQPGEGPVRVYRPASEVFRQDSLQSFSHAPVTIDHPAEPVTRDNWKALAVGEASADVIRDGERLRIPLILKDRAAIDAVRTGKRELSAGYTCELDFTAGMTADGQEYDAVQRNIRANHIALVDHGRAGSAFRFGDDAGATWGAAPLNDMETTMNLKTITFDGVSVQVTEQGAQIIDKLNQKIADAATTAEAVKTDHARALAARDADLARKDAEIDALKAKVLSDADIDRLAADRAELLAKAKAIVPSIATDGLSAAAIRKAVVVAKIGDAAVDGKPDAYIEARFDCLVEDAAKSPDPAMRALARDAKAPAVVRDNGQAEYEARLVSAWRDGKAA